MDYLTALALSLAGTPAVSLADALRFPGHADCVTEYNRCQEHLDRLWYYGMASPWSPERERDVRQVEAWARLWGVLALAVDCDRDPAWRLDALQTVRQALGEHNYRRGLVPCRVPSGLPTVPQLHPEVMPGANQ